MKIYKKNIIILVLFSVVLIAISSFLSIKFKDKNKICPIVVEIRDSENNEKIIYSYENNDQYYIFLPSYSNDSNTLFNISKKAKVFNYGKEIGDLCYLEEGQYTIEFSGKTKSLNILKSANVATVYIDTKKNAMDRIYNDKNVQEKVNITIYDGDGEVDYLNNKYEDKIAGRGNSTWDQDKRPFNISLKRENELLGMESSSDWALLANAYDSSNIRDLIYKKLAMYSCFEYTPDSRYVDLYINGEYNGLYQLSEKIDVEENRLNIDSDSYLCTFEYWQRWDKLDNPIKTDNCDITVNVIKPKKLNDSELDEAKLKIQSMENAIISKDDIDLASGKNLEELIDLDSWVKGYLIDEITKNLDTNLASSYFYWNEDDKICKGPVWDGDRTLGSDFRNNNSSGFFAARIYRSDDNYNQYYYYLMKKDIFKNRALEIYKETFAPIINNLINDEIDEIGTILSKASKMNYTRWSDMYSYLIDYQNQEYVTCDDVKDYLADRKNYLDNNLNSINDYCYIYLQLENGSFYIDNVKKGEKYSLPDYSQFDNLKNIELLDENSGADFSFDNAIKEDVRVVPKLAKVTQEEHTSLITIILNNSKIITAVGTFVLLIVFMICLIIIDRKNTL